MAMITKVYPVVANGAGLGDRQVRVICSTPEVDRAGEVIEQDGIDLSEFAENPIALWSHNAEHPVGTVKEIGIKSGLLQALVEFAPEGVSEKADEICRLVKGGIVKAVSVGFDPVEMEPMDPARPRGPQRYVRSKLLELSFVAIPCNRDAMVVERKMTTKAKAASEWKVSASRDLPIEDSDEWDGAAAEKSIFDYAGGDEFDSEKARKGFLVYDSANPADRGSYKLPIAHVVGGELKVPKGAIRAAASRLPDSDLPQDVKDGAGEVIAAYEKKAGIGENADKGDGKTAKPRRKAGRASRTKERRFKGLWDIGRLAWLLEDLGYEHECARIEAALEGDASKIPEMLAAIMQDLGATLIAMTQEEVGEFLADKDVDDVDEGAAALPASEVEIVVTAKTPAQRKFRLGRATARATAANIKSGAGVSPDICKAMQTAVDLHDGAMNDHRNAMRKHAQVATMMQDIIDGGSTEGDGTDNGAGADSGKAASPVTKSGPDFRRRQADALALADPQ